jgi:prepilin-type N-terminal cleavage/methylation domain-containing protein/prepilin-type processing-associated H-X9-DG protein
MQSCKRRQGFTLIELLVVIAIIAILAAILFPVFAKAREKARQASCQSNLKQVALGVLMYIQDYDEKPPCTPYWECGRPNNSTTTRWYAAIYPYVKNQQLFACPSSPSAGGWPRPNAPYNAGVNWNGIDLSYGMGRWADCTNANPYEKSGFRIARYQYPANSLLAADSAHHDDGCSRWEKIAYASVCGAGCNPGNQTETNTRHNGGADLAFMDGHVKWFSAGRLAATWQNQVRPGPCCPNAPT